MKPIRLAGLPLHPMLVHFPVAAWTVATGLAVVVALDVLAEAATLATMARHANAFGLLTGGLAMLAGLLELLALPRDDRLRQAVIRHVTFAFTAWLVYGAAWIFQVKQMPLPAAASCAIGFGLLLVAGHAGGRIVYLHGYPAGTGLQGKQS